MFYKGARKPEYRSKTTFDEDRLDMSEIFLKGRKTQIENIECRIWLQIIVLSRRF